MFRLHAQNILTLVMIHPLSGPLHLPNLRNVHPFLACLPCCNPAPVASWSLVFFHPKMLNKDVTLTCAWVQSWYLETWQMLWENNSVNNWNLSLWTKLNPETRSCKIRQWLCAIYLMILTQPRSTCFRFVGGDMTSLNMTVEYFCWKYICNLYYIYYIYTPCKMQASDFNSL